MKGNDPTVYVVVVGKTRNNEDKENDETEPEEPQRKAKKVLTILWMLEYTLMFPLRVGRTLLHYLKTLTRMQTLWH